MERAQRTFLVLSCTYLLSAVILHGEASLGEMSRNVPFAAAVVLW